MKYYRFKTNNTSYYFPSIHKETRFFYGMFTPYRFAVSVYWLLWKKLHALFSPSIDENLLPFPYKQIVTAEKEKSEMAFCMGTPGVQQKISLLGYERESQRKFFAKFAQKKEAIKLCLHEIEVLEKLKDTKAVPLIYDKKTGKDFVFFKTEYVQGQKLKKTKADKYIMTLLITLRELGVSHKDFCPWNILKTKNGLKIIDWETAEAYIPGYDLFTYIFQTAFLLDRKQNCETIFQKNSSFISQYFNNERSSIYQDILREFAKLKLKEEMQKDKNGYLVIRYKELQKYAETL